jgi:DNA-binding MarR family transcriptional regulator
MKDDTDIILRHWQNALPDDRVAHLIKDATRALVRSLQKKLNKQNVPFSHWTFLRILWEQDGMTQRELSVEAGVMEPTTANVVRQMEEKGYITRRHLGNNMRRRHVFLTQTGRKLKNKLEPLAEAVNRIATQTISPDEIESLRQSLLKMIKNLWLESTGDF